jgi:hypothetical protein
MPTHDPARDKKGPAVGVVLIGDAYTQARSMIMGMIGAAHAAAAMVADGATWEGDESILIPPAAKPHALRMAEIWRRAAAQSEGRESPVTRREPTPSAVARA